MIAGGRPSDTSGGLRWYFLTTGSAHELMPLVEGFGQDIRYTIDRSNGKPRWELSHVLKLFLIDAAGFIREIYTSAFLHPRTVLNDIEPLLIEGAAPGSKPRVGEPTRLADRRTRGARRSDFAGAGDG